MTDQAFYLLLLGWAVGGASPGPATLTIAGAAMAHGRSTGLAVASGVICGSAFWGIAAALGMSALMLAHGWLVEVLRYVGAAYLMYLAFKAARAAWRNQPLRLGATAARAGFKRGLSVHLTNPKPIFGWGAIFAVMVPPGSDPVAIAQVFAALISVSCVVFWGYGLAFSSQAAIASYARLRRWFEGVFALMFGAAGLKILTARVVP